MKHVIIGNGIAGIQAAETIRKLQPQASIALIAGEAFPPYCRPMISMVLQGTALPHQLQIRPSDFYSKASIQAHIGEWANQIDVDARSVLTSSGKQVPFDRLLIATGADPRPIKAHGADLENIFFMRTEAHVRGMVEALPGVKNALVLGGGLVGFKAAYGLLHRGVRVVMLISSGYPLSMQVDPVAGGLILDELKEKGLEVRVGSDVAAFEGNGKVREAHLKDGAKLPCGLVVIGKGVLPATAIVPKDRIGVDLGILVDDRLETTVPGIFAAGDVAEHFDLARQTRWVNAIWPVAVEQGMTAGMNMAGRNVAYKGSLARNVIRIFEMDVLTGGLVNPPEHSGHEILVRHNPRKKTYRKLVFRDDCLVGVSMINDIEQGGILISMIQQAVRVSLPKEKLMDAHFNYGCLLP